MAGLRGMSRECKADQKHYDRDKHSSRKRSDHNYNTYWDWNMYTSRKQLWERAASTYYAFRS